METVMGKPDYTQIVEKILAVQDSTKTAEQLALRQSRENATKASLLFRESGISKRHKLFDASASSNKEWSSKFESLKAVLGKGVIALVLGNRGTGKSQIATCAIKHSCDELRPARYVKAFDFFLEVRETYSKETAQKTESQVVTDYLNPFLLVIDAIENRSDSQFENLLLNHLIDLRYDAMKDTILIGNMDEALFAATMGPSIVSRVNECGLIVSCKWPSFRH